MSHRSEVGMQAVKKKGRKGEGWRGREGVRKRETCKMGREKKERKKKVRKELGMKTIIEPTILSFVRIK